MKPCGLFPGRQVSLRQCLGVCVLALASACHGENEANSCCETAPSKAAEELLIPPEGDVWFGTFATMDESRSRQRFEEFAHLAGKAPAIHLIFRDWAVDGEGNFPVQFAANAYSMGAVPLVSWEPWWDFSEQHYPLMKDIAAGQYDEYLAAFLAQAASFDKPWFLRFAHEMEGQSYPWTSAMDQRQSADHYVAAFRHVTNMARRLAPETIVVWSPNSGSARALRYYPGPEYVDWIGASLYNFPDAPQAPDHIDKLSGWMPMVRELGKPAMIAEMGCAEEYSVTPETIAAGKPSTPKLASWMDLDMADKSVCLNRTFDVIETRYPDIQALIWFDIDKEADWRINSSERSLGTFVNRIAAPRYRAAPLNLISGADQPAAGSE